MRRHVWWLTALLLGLLVLSAQAGPMTFGVNGGVLKGTGDFGDVSETGYGAGAFGDYWFTNAIAGGLDFSWNTAKVKDAPSSDDKWTIMNYGAHAKYMFPMGEMPLKVYGVLGLGGYNLKLAQTGLSDQTDNKFGGRGGLGFEYMMGGQFGLGAEGNFHVISTEGNSTQMITGVAMLTYHMPMTAK